MLYFHPEEQYKNLWEPSDHYLYKPNDLYDYTAWDIRKALQLLWKGNAQIYELFFSPEIYLTGPLAEEFKEFSLNVLNENLKNVAYHYYGLAYKTFKERIAEVGEPTVKKYFYVLRPLLHVESMTTHGTLPALVFQDVLEDAKHNDLAPKNVIDTAFELLALKREGNLTKADKLRIEHVDEFCKERLDYWKEHLGKWKFSMDDNENYYTTTENFNKMYKRLAFFAE